MKLPKDSIGVSDIQDWAECPRRMSFQMQRHELGKDPPEAAVNPNVRYGSALHDAVEVIENADVSDDQAIQHLMSNGHRWLTPDVIEELKADLRVYREREPLGVRTVMNETEIRVPLMKHNGVQIFYRARIDRLYESLTTPGLFFHRDYKGSNWPKSQAEVDEDKQMSAYNWSLHEYLPEIETLVQIYDQLHFGEIETSRTEAQRQATFEWLKMAAVAILEDEEYGPDGLLVPEFNRWCAYCPIMESCAVVPELTNYALAEIAKLAPERKVGRKTTIDLDDSLFDVYVEQLRKASAARGVLDKFEKAVKERLRELPLHEREQYGYTLRTRSLDVFSAEALRAAHNVLGDDEFYRLVTLSKQAVTAAVGEDKAKLDLILGMADRVPSRPFVVEKRTGRAS